MTERLNASVRIEFTDLLNRFGPEGNYDESK